MSRIPNRLQFKDPQTPYSEVFDDVYFANGFEESIHVYLEGSGVNQAIRDHKKQIRVGEVGFGVGLNFLVTLRAFLDQATSEQTLHYISVEKYPIEVEDLWTLYRAYPDLLPYAEQLLNQYPVLTPGLHRLFFGNHRVTLDLMIGDAKECFQDHDFTVDYWYWDGFAPSKNPEAFSDELFSEIEKRSSLGAQGSSFTAAGWVRRSLESHQFKVSKKPGFGKKRERIEGIYLGQPSQVTDQKQSLPWFSRELFILLKNPSARIAVIGAGLAGSAIARALAERGFSVQVFDENGIASGASSNSVGLFNVQLSKKQNPLSRFAQASLTHFLREVEALKVPHRKGIDRIGCDAAQALMACDYPDAFFEATLKGVRLSQCGIINPQTLCATRLNHCKIHFVKSRVSKVISTNGIHTLFSNDGKSLGDFDHVVFTTGHQIDLNLDVPVQSVRGQTILIHPTESSKKINWARVEDGYLTPVAPEITGHGFQVIGATYQAKTVLPDQEKIDSENLLAEATRKWEEFSELSPSHLVKAKAGMRASTPDKLPLIGPLCDAHYLSTHYFSALKGASVKNLPALEVKPGLWILMGLGSRGITFSSLGSEILASLMTGQSLPIEDSIFAHLHPVRFPVRNLRKN